MERGGEAFTHSIPKGFKINRYIPNPQNLIPVRESSPSNNFIGDLYGYKVKVVDGVIGAIKTNNIPVPMTPTIPPQISSIRFMINCLGVAMLTLLDSTV